MESTNSSRDKTEAVVLSPPGNPAAFSETREFLDDAVVLHDWRFKESDLISVHDMVREYRTEVPEEIVGQVDKDKFDAMYIACTGMSYGHTPDEDHSYWQGLEASSGVHIATATRAVEELWRGKGYDSMIIVSPYDDKATSQAEEYWSQAGFSVKQIIRVSGGHPYRVTSDDLHKALQNERLVPGVPVLLSGTGMRTKDSLAWIESMHDAPVWSVNLAGAEWLRGVTK